MKRNRNPKTEANLPQERGFLTDRHSQAIISISQRFKAQKNKPKLSKVQNEQIRSQNMEEQSKCSTRQIDILSFLETRWRVSEALSQLSKPEAIISRHKQSNRIIYDCQRICLNFQQQKKQNETSNMVKNVIFEEVVQDFRQLETLLSMVLEKLSSIESQNYLSPRDHLITSRQKYRNGAESTNHASRKVSAKPKNHDDISINNRSSQVSRFNEYQVRQNFGSSFIVADNQYTKEHIDLNSERNSIKEGSVPNDEELLNYFYSYIITLSATELEYRPFLEKLLNGVKFTESETEAERKSVEFMMSSDTDYAVRLLSEVYQHQLSSSSDQEASNDQKSYHFVPLSEDPCFLSIVQHFIDQESSNSIAQIKQYCQKSIDVQEILERIEQLNALMAGSNSHFDEENHEGVNVDALTKYLPTDEIPLNEFTFSPRSIGMIHQKITQTKKELLYNKHFLTSALNVFRKNIVKIGFDRIRFCRRYEYSAVLTMANAVQTSNLYRDIITQSFKNVQERALEVIEEEQFANFVFEKMLKSKLQRVWQGWKLIKIRREKLLKKFVNKKIIADKKQQFIAISKWRVNASRLRLQQKMLCHSQSCNSVIRKYAKTENKTFKEDLIRPNVEEFQAEKGDLKVLQKQSNLNTKGSLPKSKKQDGSDLSINKTKNKMVDFQYREKVVHKLNQSRKDYMKATKQRNPYLSKNNRSTMNLKATRI